MDKKKFIINVTVAIFFKFIVIFLTLYVRRLLIKNIGNEVNGINSLFLSIVNFLSIIELGLGTAIIFSMYKPIVEGDSQKVSALYDFLKKVYISIGIFTFAIGLLIMPFLSFLIKDYTIDVNLYSSFLIMLISCILPYFFEYKLSLFIAHKNNYIHTTVISLGHILQYLLQITVLFTIKTYESYLFARVITCFFQIILTEIICRKYLKPIISTKNKLEKEEKTLVLKNAKALFLHKFGDILVNTLDSIIISAFIGVVVLGYYSNYLTLIIAMESLLALFFTSVTSIVGHFLVKKDKKATLEYFNFFHNINFIIGLIAYLGFFCIIDDAINLIFGENLLLSREIVLIISLNYFIQFMRKSILLFRDASGNFYHDRYKSIVEGFVNLFLSIVFVQFWGLIGVIIATIVTNLLISYIVSPYVLYKYTFENSAKSFYLKNYGYIILFTLIIFLTYNFIDFQNSNLIVDILLKGGIAIIISCLVIITIIIFDKNFRIKLYNNLMNIKKIIFKRGEKTK